MQIRANAESAAFYRCGHLERQKTNHKLEALIQTQNRLQLKEYGLNCKLYKYCYNTMLHKEKVI